MSQGRLLADRKVFQHVTLGALIHVHDGPPEILQADVPMFDGLPDTFAPFVDIVGHLATRSSF